MNSIWTPISIDFIYVDYCEINQLLFGLCSSMEDHLKPNNSSITRNQGNWIDTPRSIIKCLYPNINSKTDNGFSPVYNLDSLGTAQSSQRNDTLPLTYSNSTGKWVSKYLIWILSSWTPIVNINGMYLLANTWDFTVKLSLPALLLFSMFLHSPIDLADSVILCGWNLLSLSVLVICSTVLLCFHVTVFLGRYYYNCITNHKLVKLESVKQEYIQWWSI